MGYSEIPQQRTPLETKILSVIERCPQLRGFWYISGRRGMCNQHNMTVFQSFHFLYADTECYAAASTMSNSANVKLLTTAGMVDNLAEKVKKCPLNRGR